MSVWFINSHGTYNGISAVLRSASCLTDPQSSWISAGAEAGSTKRSQNALYVSESVPHGNTSASVITNGLRNCYHNFYIRHNPHLSVVQHGQ